MKYSKLIGNRTLIFILILIFVILPILIAEYLFDKLNAIYTSFIIVFSIISSFLINKKTNRIFDDFFVWKEVIPLHNRTQILFIIAELFIFANDVVLKYNISVGNIELKPINSDSTLESFLIYCIITGIASWLIIYYSFRKSIVLSERHYRVRKMSTQMHQATKLDKCMRVELMEYTNCTNSMSVGLYIDNLL